MNYRSMKPDELAVRCRDGDAGARAYVAEHFGEIVAAIEEEAQRDWFTDGRYIVRVAEPLVSQMCTQGHEVGYTVVKQGLPAGCELQRAWVYDGTLSLLFRGPNAETSDDPEEVDVILSTSQEAQHG